MNGKSQPTYRRASCRENALRAMFLIIDFLYVRLLNVDAC